MPIVGEYCITGVQKHNPNDHRASVFRLHIWGFDKDSGENKWFRLGWKPANFVAKLLVEGKTVYSAKRSDGFIYTGEKFELIFRLSHNGGNYKLADMPDK